MLPTRQRRRRTILDNIKQLSSIPTFIQQIQFHSINGANDNVKTSLSINLHQSHPEMSYCHSSINLQLNHKFNIITNKSMMKRSAALIRMELMIRRSQSIRLMKIFNKNQKIPFFISISIIYQVATFLDVELWNVIELYNILPDMAERFVIKKSLVFLKFISLMKTILWVLINFWERNYLEDDWVCWSFNFHFSFFNGKLVFLMSDGALKGSWWISSWNRDGTRLL